MRPVRWLKSGWPLVSVIVVFIVGLAARDVGVGSVAATLAVLIFGPAYLIQNYVRRRRGTLVAPIPKTGAEKARSDARFMRAIAAYNVVFAAAGVAVAVSNPGHWLPGSRWTAVLVLGAAMGISSAPYLWGLADWQENKKINHLAWGLAGVLDLSFGVAAIVVATTNQRTHWIGGGAWTVVLGVLAVVWLLGAPAHLSRARA